MQILFFTDTPFTDRDFSRYRIKFFINKFAVKIVDCSPLINPEVWARLGGSKCKHLEYEVIYSVFDIYRVINNVDKNCYIFETLGTKYLAYAIRCFFLIKKMYTLNFQLGLIPHPPINKSISKLHRKIPSFFKIIFRYLFDFLDYPSLLIVSGSIIEKGSRSHKLMYGHSFDYNDFYFCEDKVCNLTINEYAVFLDENLPFHIDYLYHGIDAPVTPEVYYEELNKFFEIFERETGCEVIIAAHPRSEKSSLKWWGSRKLYFDDTMNLVKKASFVIAHSSTAISYAVLGFKPIIFVSTNQINLSSQRRWIELFAHELQRPLINISGYVHLQKNYEEEVNVLKYQNYKNRYIQSELSKINCDLFEFLSNFLLNQK